MTLPFLNGVANDAESTKNENHVIIASLKNETMGKLINRIPGSRLLISSLQGLALRTHVESQASQCQQAFSKPCLVNLDIKRHSPSILYLHTCLNHRIQELLEFCL